MKLNNKKIFKILAENKSCKKVYFRFKISQLKNKELEDLGFNKKLSFQEIIPNPINNILRQNIENKEIVRRDLKKIDKWITYEANLRDWSGYVQSVTVDKCIKVYQKDIIKAQQKKLILKTQNKLKYIQTKPININKQNDIEYYFKLITSIFNECEMIDADTNQSLQLIRQVNWEILTPGEYPWERMKKEILKVNDNKISEEKEKELEIHNSIYQKTPNIIICGKNNFNNYIVYEFDNFSILEALKKNNATYVIFNKWERYSKLTKSELIKETKDCKRIIHNNNWKKEFEILFKN